MALFAFAISLLVNVLWAGAISYGAALVSSLFAKKPDDRGTKIGSYPIEYSQKGVPIPKVYGCERLAGNVIWHGNKSSFVKKTHQPGVDEHVPITTYLRDFSIGICEGSGFIQKIWMDKLLIWASDGSGTSINNDTQSVSVEQAPAGAPPAGTPGQGIVCTTSPPIPFFGSQTTCVSWGRITISNGDDSQDMRYYTGETLGAYKDLIWAHFTHWELGPIDRIPNFTFEVSSVPAGYKYTYISENGQVIGVPLFGSTKLSLDLNGAARDVGGGIVGIPIAGHPFVDGDVISILGSTNYDFSFTLTAGTTAAEIQFTSAFSAETFNGTEGIVKLITGLDSGSGRATIDAAGNIWYAHTWDGATYITKIAPDGTRTKNDLAAPAWPINGDGSSGGGEITTSIDGRYLFLMIGYTNVGNQRIQVECYDTLDGSNVYSVDAGATTYSSDLAIDSDNNIYVPNVGPGFPAVMSKFDDAGVETNPFGNMFGGYVTDLNENVGPSDIGVLISCGFETAVPDPKNMFVSTLAGGSLVSMAVGGTSGTPPNLNAYLIRNRGGFVHDNGFIYVIASTPTPTIYKIEITWSGSSIAGIAEVASVAGPAGGIGIYMDRHKNIVVVNQDRSCTYDDTFYFYDGDLNLINSVVNVPCTAVLWGPGVGDGHIKGNAFDYPFGQRGCSDENPATIIQDLAEQNRYGAGIDSVFLDVISIATERGYFASQNQLISLALAEQMPLMDWVDFILSHCNGFRFWSEGKLHIGAFKDEASIASLDQDDLVVDEGDDPPPPVQIVKRKSSERSNRIEVQWVDRSNTYDTSVAMAKDDVDQRVSGKVAIRNADLSGIHNATYAQNQAYRLLFESMYRFSTYAFNISYKNMLLQVGDVIDVTDGHLLTSERCRIMSREEDKDGRLIKIEAIEDVGGLYPEWLYVTQQTEAPTLPQIGSDDLVEGILSYREDPNLPRSYLFFAPGSANATGALVYRSYDDITYVFVGRAVIDITTPANAVGPLLTSNMADATTVVHRPNEFFTVNIGTYASLRTNVSDPEFFGGQNLCKIGGSEIIAWKTAEDQGGGIWKVSNLIRCIDGSEGSAHGIGERFATTSLVDVFYDLAAETPGTTLYFKALPSSTIASMTLDQVSTTVIPVEAQYARPFPISLQRIEGREGFQSITGYPINVPFNLPSKLGGWNIDGYGVIPWGHFVKDTAIISVSVQLNKMDGTLITEWLFDLGGYTFGDYYLSLVDGDRSGNDPVVLSLAALKALPSSKRNEMIIEIT